MRSDYVIQTFGDVQVVTLAIGDNYVYVVSCGGETMVIDPTVANPVLRLLQEKRWNLTTILNTHGDSDHVGGNLALKKATGCQVFGPRTSSIPGRDHPVDDGDTIKLGPMTVEALSTPGHGTSHVSYYAPASGRSRPGMVWTGDALFVGGCGRLFDGTPEDMWASLQRLAQLPDATLVYCGHEYSLENYRFAIGLEPDNGQVIHRLEAVQTLLNEGRPTVPSTIASEKRLNPFMRSGEQALKDVLDMAEASDVEVFTRLREWKDRF